MFTRRSGSSSNSSLLDPTINVSDAALAPLEAPDIGVSIMTMFFGALALKSRINRGDRVEQIRKNFFSSKLKIYICYKKMT